MRHTGKKHTDSATTDSSSLNGKVAKNPNYGNGIFRRRIQLVKAGLSVEVVLEDCSHAMSLNMHHNDTHIVSMAGIVKRGPVTSCQSAPEKLQDFIGLSLHNDLNHYRRLAPANSHCTHLHDMALLAIEHSQQKQTTHQFDIAVADEQEGLIKCEIQLDGEIVHRWSIRNAHIETPTKYRGQAVFKGFIAWANQHFEESALRCAFALQRGILVAGARRWDMASVAGEPADTFGPGLGVCYSYSQDRQKNSLRSHNPTRDFTHTPEQLLTFK